MKILVVDIGGSNVKILSTGHEKRRKFPSGSTFTPAEMVEGVLHHAADWEFDVVTIGIPAPVKEGKPVRDPRNLGPGWSEFDFEAAFEVPTRIVNDAAMQALGSYEGGTMLFLGLGTGLGSALVSGGHVIPLELAHLPYRDASYEHYVGERGLDRLGRKRWQEHVFEVSTLLREATVSDYVVIGGGNVKKLQRLPPDSRAGNNRLAFVGGFRVWEPGYIA